MQTTPWFAAILLFTSAVQAEDLAGATREFGYKVRVDGKVTYQHVDPGPSSPREFRALELPEDIAASWRCTASIWFLDLSDEKHHTTYQEVVCRSSAGKPTQTLVTKCRHDVESTGKSELKLELKGHEVSILGSCKTELRKKTAWGFTVKDWKWSDDSDDEDEAGDS